MGVRPCPLPVLERLRREQLSEAQRRLARSVALHEERSQAYAVEQARHAALSARLVAARQAERRHLQDHDTPAARIALADFENDQHRRLAASASLVEAARQSMDQQAGQVAQERRALEQAQAAHRLVEERWREEMQQRIRRVDDLRDEEALEQRNARQVGRGRQSGGAA